MGTTPYSDGATSGLSDANDKLQEIIDLQGGSDEKAAFGGLLVVESTPVYQEAFVHSKLLPRIVQNTNASGSISLSGQKVVLQTGVSVGGYAAIRTKKYLRYNPARGSVTKFTGLFDSANAVANSLQLLGVGTAEAGVYIGYDGTKLGVCRQFGGRLEIRSFVITTASSTTESIAYGS